MAKEKVMMENLAQKTRKVKSKSEVRTKGWAWKDRIHSKFFTPEELACRCGDRTCPDAPLSVQVIAPLEEMRRILGIPLPVTSGARCRRYNKEVGGKRKSLHIADIDREGFAVDIGILQPKNSDFWWVIKTVALKVGFTRIGLYYDGGFIHLAVDPKGRLVTFLGDSGQGFGREPPRPKFIGNEDSDKVFRQLAKHVTKHRKSVPYGITVEPEAPKVPLLRKKSAQGAALATLGLGAASLKTLDDATGVIGATGELLGSNFQLILRLPPEIMFPILGVVVAGFVFWYFSKTIIAYFRDSWERD